MSLSRRLFLADASALGMLAALLPQLAAQETAAQAPAATEDLPHDSYDFWNGFFDSVNPYSSDYGNKAASRGPTDQLPDPKAQTQYLHYDSERKRLRYASDIQKEELLDHDGDVAVSIALSQFRPGEGESNLKASQLRVDTTQVHPFVDILTPLAWSAIASVAPNKMRAGVPGFPWFQICSGDGGDQQDPPHTGNRKVGRQHFPCRSRVDVCQGPEHHDPGRKNCRAHCQPAGNQRACTEHVHRSIELLGRPHPLHHGRQPDPRCSHTAGVG